jgi:hypothetical protein
MAQLKLFGEGQPQGGTTDHSALANLGYAQSGHTGFVPSQGEALIEILRCTTRASIGSGATPSTESLLRVIGTLDTHPAVAGYFLVYGNRAGVPQFTYGLSGGARGQGTPSASFVYGLYFFAQHDSPSFCYQLGGILIQQQSGASGTGALSQARGLYISQGYWAGSKPSSVYGVDIEDQGGSGVGTAYGLRILNQTASTVRLLELGPTTPYLRLLGGADPPTDKSNLYLKFGSTLYRVVKSGDYMALEAA